MRPGLTVAQVASILDALGQAEAVLIGGQALQIWCDLFVDAVPELEAESPFTSKDVDVQGDRRVVEVCARLLRVSPRYPSTMDATNVALLEVPTDDRTIEVNVLTSPFGVDARRAHETALTASVGDGISIRVLHPILCMESRLANVVGLYRTREHDLRQARASILVARAYLAAVAREDPREALTLSELVFRYARDDFNAKRAFSLHALDAFFPVDAHPGLPNKFETTRLPQMRAAIGRIRGRSSPGS